jgi:hypothetical protein
VPFGDDAEFADEEFRGDRQNARKGHAREAGCGESPTDRARKRIRLPDPADQEVFDEIVHNAAVCSGDSPGNPAVRQFPPGRSLGRLPIVPGTTELFEARDCGVQLFQCAIEKIHNAESFSWAKMAQKERTELSAGMYKVV